MKVYSYLTPGSSPKERGVGAVQLSAFCPVRDNRSVENNNTLHHLPHRPGWDGMWVEKSLFMQTHSVPDGTVKKILACVFSTDRLSLTGQKDANAANFSLSLCGPLRFKHSAGAGRKSSTPTRYLFTMKMLLND
ncbi:MAG: hypothetical protein LBS46_04450 [Dysgonamonadaceae bacterium]|nr:hypothetical protein [Dysgonamonadaceae bacterium]